MSPGRDGLAPLIFHRATPLAPPPSGQSAEPGAMLDGGQRRKPFSRRHGDRSQRIRAAVQLGFMAVTLLVGVQFYLWVRYYETGGRTPRPSSDSTF